MAAIFPGIIAFLMYTKLQQVVGASITGLTVYLMPIYGAIYGIFLSLQHQGIRCSKTPDET